MRGDAGQSLEHLVALDPEAALVGVEVRQQRRPDRVGMQHRADVRLLGDGEVQAGLGGRLLGAGFEELALVIDEDEIGLA